MAALALLDDRAFNRMLPNEDARVVAQEFRALAPVETVGNVPLVHDIAIFRMAWDAEAEVYVVRGWNRAGATFEAPNISAALDRAAAILADLVDGESLGGTAVLIQEMDRLSGIGLDIS